LFGGAGLTHLSSRTCLPLPVIDGIHFKDTPTALVMKRKLSTMPILAGATTDESFATTNDFTLELKNWHPTLSEKDVKNFKKIYKSDDFEGNEHKRVRAAVGEPPMRCGVRLPADS
jgi:hypothetical protein